jgi:hypothetical protein
MTSRTFYRIARAAVAALAGISLLGCASIETAQMALPTGLAGEPTPVAGLGAGRTGAFSVGDERGRFQRGRDALSLFEVVSFDRAATRYELTLADGATTQAACVGRQTTVTVNVLTGQPKPYTVTCEWKGARNAQMTLAAPSWIPGTRAERSGRYTAGDVTLELRSVHQVQGSPLPLEAPIGYAITHNGQAVGAVEINGTTPRLWRPAAGSPLREPVTMAALAVALLWDPAAGLP